MSPQDNLAIHEEDSQRINQVLLHFLGESGAMEAHRRAFSVWNR